MKDLKFFYKGDFLVVPCIDVPPPAGVKASISSDFPENFGVFLFPEFCDPLADRLHPHGIIFKCKRNGVSSVRKNQDIKPDTMIKDLTRGNVTAQLFAFAAPLFAANALQAVYNLVDMVIVGRVNGGAGMSAVSIGGDVLHLLTFLAMGFSSAGQVIIARMIGAGNPDAVRKLIGTMFSFLLSASAVISVICYLMRGTILDLLNTPAESYEFTMDYMVPCIAGLIFIYGYNIVSAILRGMGDSRRPFLFIGVAAVLNTVLDLVFVAVFHMGPFGAALATVIGQGVSFLTSLVYLYIRWESFGFDFRPESFRIDRYSLTNLLKLGIPMAIQSAAVSISKIVLTSWINAEGVIYSALAGIYNKTGLIMAVVSNSFTTAGSTMVGQNLGAGKRRRVIKTVAAVGSSTLIFSTAVSALILLFPGPFCSFFTEDAGVLAESSLIILPVILNNYGAATRSPAFAFINGSGNSRMNLLVAVLDGMIARVGLASLLGFALGLRSQGFWLGDALAGYMPLLIGSMFFLKFLRVSGDGSF